MSTHCDRCAGRIIQSGQGRPRIRHKVCPEFPDLRPFPRQSENPVLVSRVSAPPAPPAPLAVPALKPPPPTRTPFNSTPTTAVIDPARADTEGAGPFESGVLADLASLRSTSPFARSLGQTAVRIARALDGVPDTDLPTVLKVTKELRSVLNELAKTMDTEVDDGDSDTPFGSSHPTLVHSP